jgi:hypothetical protein
MLKKIFSWFSYVETKTHDLIVQPLQKIVDELHDYAAHHSLQQVMKGAAVENLKAEVESHAVEAAKAVATATRINAVIGGGQ